MPDLKLCSRDDVINLAFRGDLSQVVALTRSDPTQPFDYTKLDFPILLGSSDVELAAGNRFALQPSDDPTTYPLGVRRMAATRAAYWLWFRDAAGTAMPPELQALVDALDAELDRLRKGEQGLGGQKTPPRRYAAVAYVDLTDGGAFPRMSLDGFRRL